MTAVSDPTPLMQKQKPHSWWWLYGSLILFMAAVAAFNIFQPILVLPRITLSPGYAFTNQIGGVVTSEDYRGQMVLYSVSHTACAADCPQNLTQIKALRDALAQALPADLAVSLATISVNPEIDTPAVMAQALDRVGVDDAENGRIPWVFLTGDPVRTKFVIGGGFGVYYDNKDGVVQFDPAYFLVDGWGIIRAEYRTPAPDIDILVRDIGLVAEEVNNSEGAARVAYEAAHLFSCYPK
jgi:protein SCO1/2